MQHKEGSRRKRKKHDDDHGGSAHLAHDESNWLVSYADMMTLLFGFFVLMYSFSKVDEDKFQVVRKDLVKYFGGTMKESVGASNLKKIIEAEVSKMMGEGGFSDQVNIKVRDNYIQMNFESQLIFPPGSAELTASSANIVDKIAQELKKLPVEDIEVEGHTDIDAIQSAIFPSNWELSTARSSRIVRRLNENGLDDKKLTALGYGSARPEVPHADAAGKVIAENKIKNRRVILNIRLKPDGNLALADIEKMGFRSVASENIETAEEAKQIKETNDKTADIKKKIEAAKIKNNEIMAKLKAAKELENSVKEMDKLNKKNEELERKVQSIEKPESSTEVPATGTTPGASTEKK